MSPDGTNSRPRGETKNPASQVSGAPSPATLTREIAQRGIGACQSKRVLRAETLLDDVTSQQLINQILTFCWVSAAIALAVVIGSEQTHSRVLRTRQKLAIMVGLIAIRPGRWPRCVDRGVEPASCVSRHVFLASAPKLAPNARSRRITR
jgi:hypothetical protein